MVPSPAPLSPGQLLGEKYEILDVIGVGGMGVVYEGRHVKLGQRVAIKLLTGKASELDELCKRFQREARAAATLRGRHVARVTDVDALEDGRPYMVMELLEGCDLADALELRGPFAVHEAVDLMLQACTAMAEAHQHGIIHRDLKPGNLFLTEEDGTACLKVLDFGISKVTEDEQISMTMTSTALGTPLYMSPEQIRSAKHVDRRCDVWSLGIILYELLTGHTPFDGQSATAVIAAITADQPAPVTQLRPEIPQGLDHAILRALEKRPDDRFPSVEAFAEAIAAYGTKGRWSATTSGFRPVSQPNPSPDEERALEEARTQAVIDTDGIQLDTVEKRQNSDKRRIWLVAALVAAGLALGGAGYLWSERSPSQGSAAKAADRAPSELTADEEPRSEDSSGGTLASSEPASEPAREPASDEPERDEEEAADRPAAPSGVPSSPPAPSLRPRPVATPPPPPSPAPQPPPKPEPAAEPKNPLTL